jgi:hypothetical protein
MRRAFAFLFLVLLFVALTFPQERFLLSLLEEPLRESKIDLRLGGASFALPAGWQADDIALDGEGFGLNLDSVYLGLTKTLDIRGCGGWLAADLDGRDDLTVDFGDLDPSRCLRIGDARLEGRFEGEVHLLGIGRYGLLALGNSGSIRLRSNGGTLSGRLPADDSAAGVEIGEWEFGEIDVDIDLHEGALEVREIRAVASGVAFEGLGGRAWEGLRGDTEVELEFRAKPVEETARAKAILGMLPRAEAGYDGWRRYRLTGHPGDFKLIGLR